MKKNGSDMFLTGEFEETTKVQAGKYCAMYQIEKILDKGDYL